MIFITGLLTFVFILNCLLLILLVLIQLPKKEAGAGIAFGSGTTDVLFGAGSGNVLTKITKYAAATFMVMALMLSVMSSRQAKETRRKIGTVLQDKANNPGPIENPNQIMSTNPAVKSLVATNLSLTTTNAAATNAPPTNKIPPNAIVPKPQPPAGTPATPVPAAPSPVTTPPRTETSPPATPATTPPAQPAVPKN